MRFRLRQPDEPTDLRELTFASDTDLEAVAPTVAEHPTEIEAKYHVRRIWSGAVAMPFPLAIGSGQTVMLGVLADASRPVSSDSKIPFSMFVQPVSETDADRDRIRRYLNGKQELWNRDLWRVKPARPEFAKSHSVEVRASELEVPFFTEARVGHVEGRLVLFLELGPDHELSVHFDDTALALAREPIPIVTLERQTPSVESPGVRDSSVRALRSVPADDDRDEAG